ncbi:Acyl-coenzyme A:6-aminopenicillanic acid acyl-transferase [Andreprevotia lacus DSM 23236]|uniref:Acyl-coenzyme A:6-aminopenicillanic acid acyl-transferase n=1 Tax=Andreprevotia lacus DSM 23236 TaxID=1121001 RepID=A0A1W1XB11_9NEIS|nr:carcinine hydrolase/isopenicillin-N N-acyltransferase family protein [Andreprevotia lacus]SMC20954.1 Acyl-coenzyme A:6-aminopenicillanic acid acyl-transferase [Andreprevotia lacus DSM 23236]
MRHALLLALVTAALAAPAYPCTLWGAAGSASAEGTLLAKNRDWLPDHVQSLRLVRPARGLRYVGLYADNGSEPGIKAGVNEAGLSIVCAEASSLPKTVRDAVVASHPLVSPILRQYRTLDEVQAHADELFTGVKPDFFLLADSKGLMQVEVGQDGRYTLQRTQNGTQAHTNHYTDPAVLNNGQKIGTSSAVRLARVQTLLAQAQQPHTLAEFTHISADHHDGPDNSLWRDHTLAGWQIALPTQAAPHLHLVLANPGRPQQSKDWTLDSNFWNQSAGVLLGGPEARASADAEPAAH